MEKIKVCAYCRVSTDSKDQANSFANQKSYFLDYTTNNNEYELTKIYADEGISGTQYKKRDAFFKMLKDAGIDVKKGEKDYEFITDNDRKPKFKKILIKDVTRFARNIDAIRVYRALVEKKVSLIVPTAGREFSTVHDEFLLSLLLTFAQEESTQKSVKVKFGVEQSAKAGRMHTNTSLYGYDYDVITKELTIVDEEAEIIKKIFEYYVEANLGVRKIAEYLDDEQIKTRQGKPFNKSTILKILQNEKYCGTLVRNKYDTGEFMQKRTTWKIRNSDEWEVFEDRIPAIISKELFDKAQEKRTSRRTRDNKGYYKRDGEFINKIICDRCKAPYYRNVDKGRVFFNCSTKKLKGVKYCDSPNIGLDDLEKCIKKLQEGYIYNLFWEDDKHTSYVLTQLKEHLNTKLDSDSSQLVSEKNKYVDELKLKKDRLYDLYSDGVLSKEDITNKITKIDDQIKDVSSEILDLSKSNDEIKNEIKEIDIFLEQLNRKPSSKKYTREEVFELLDSFKIVKVVNENFFLLGVYLKRDILIQSIFGKYKDYRVKISPVSGLEFKVPLSNNHRYYDDHGLINRADAEYENLT